MAGLSDFYSGSMAPPTVSGGKVYATPVDGLSSYFASPRGMDPSSMYKGIYAPTSKPSISGGLTSTPVKTVKIDLFGNPILPTMAASAAPAPSVPSANGTLSYTKDQSRLTPGPTMQPNPALDAIGNVTSDPLSLLKSLELNWGAAAPPPVDSGLVTPGVDPWAGGRIGESLVAPNNGRRAAAPRAGASPVAQMFDTGPSWITAAPGLDRQQTHDGLMDMQKRSAARTAARNTSASGIPGSTVGFRDGAWVYQ